MQNLSDVRREFCVFYEDLLKKGLTLRVRVTGKSMEPFLRGNEILFIRKVEASSLHIGDLVLFKDPCGMPILHRIVRKIQNGNGRISFCTKGDALLAPDDMVPPEEVMGKVYEIRKVLPDGQTRCIYMESYLQRTFNYLKALISFLKAQIYQAGSRSVSAPLLRSVLKKVFL